MSYLSVHWLILLAPPGNHIELYHNGMLNPETVGWLLSLLSSTIVQGAPEAARGFEFITVPQPFIPRQHLISPILREQNDQHLDQNLNLLTLRPNTMCGREETKLDKIPLFFCKGATGLYIL